jgi:hypothetical protein
MQLNIDQASIEAAATRREKTNQQKQMTKSRKTTTKRVMAGCAPLPCSAGCAKCGSSDIHRKYYAEGEDTNGVRPNRKGKSSALVNRKDADLQPALHECIVHTCRCCGYSWDSDSLPNVKVMAPPRRSLNSNKKLNGGCHARLVVLLHLPMSGTPMTTWRSLKFVSILHLRGRRR